ncbi:MAG: sigma-E processing peptidase SpoIIGA [Clostridia bacterium]|nr:sigma-E processing peptidase SpoIIGA [Clostridia bacterium]MBR3552577.1 sigma-E processing peptidase SpoIIGA [Clostridia bacterium]
MTVYADILFFLNLYVNYFLLRLTQALSHEPLRRLRLTGGAVLGGGYAMIIFCSLPHWALTLTRVIVAAGLVFVAFGRGTVRRFLRLFATFFAVNFAFAGLMFALWFFVRPRSLLCFGSVVYFDLNVPLLVLFTALCYGLLTLARKLIALRRPPDALFTLTVALNGRSVTCSALLDTGNAVTEPFSGFPVIFVEREVCVPLLAGTDTPLRCVPIETLGGTRLLRAFRPTEAEIRGARVRFTTRDVFLALTDEPLRGGAFRALLPPGLFDNPTATPQKELTQCVFFSI